MFRHADYLGSLLRFSEIPHASVRRSLVVALGLLGVPAEYEKGKLNPADADDAAAFAFAVVLADWNNALQRLEDMRGGLRGPARRVVDMAMMSLRAGYAFRLLGNAAGEECSCAGRRLRSSFGQTTLHYQRAVHPMRGFTCLADCRECLTSRQTGERGLCVDLPGFFLGR